MLVRTLFFVQYCNIVPVGSTHPSRFFFYITEKQYWHLILVSYCCCALTVAKCIVYSGVALHVCFLHIKPFFLLVDIQHTHCLR